MARLSASLSSISQCHVRIVSATMRSSVRMREVKEMLTMWMRSESNNNNAT